MTPEQFSQWLQGFAELSEFPPSQAQWQSIKQHLATVFNKVTPEVKLTVKAPTGKELEEVLRKIKMNPPAKEWTPNTIWPNQAYRLGAESTGTPPPYIPKFIC